MTRILRLGVAIEGSRIDASGTSSSDVWREMATRSCHIQVADIADCDAIVTDDGDLAGSHASEGRPVLVAAPWSIADETRRKLEGCAAAMPAVTPRFRADARAIRHAVESGQLGAPGLLRVHQWRRDFQVTEDAAIAPQLGLACWLLGAAPNSVYAVQQRNYLQVHLGFAGGGMALLDWNGSESKGFDAEYESLSLIGASGSAYSDDHHNSNLWFHEHGVSAVRVDQRKAALTNVLEAFAQGVVTSQGFAANWREVEASLSLVRDVRAALNDRDAVTRHDTNYELDQASG